MNWCLASQWVSESECSITEWDTDQRKLGKYKEKAPIDEIRIIIRLVISAIEHKFKLWFELKCIEHTQTHTHNQTHLFGPYICHHSPPFHDTIYSSLEEIIGTNDKPYFSLVPINKHKKHLINGLNDVKERVMMLLKCQRLDSFCWNRTTPSLPLFHHQISSNCLANKLLTSIDRLMRNWPLLFPIKLVVPHIYMCVWFVCCNAIDRRWKQWWRL